MAALPLPARNSMPTPSAPAARRGKGMSLLNLAAHQGMLSQRMVLQTGRGGSAPHLKAARDSLALFDDSQARLVDTPRQLEPGSAAAIRHL